MEAWHIVLIVLTLIGYYAIGCIVANKVCTILRDDIDLVVTAIFWPIWALGKVLMLPFKVLE